MRKHHITMDAEEARLIEKYEEKFGGVPPVAFLDPPTSKKMYARFPKLISKKIGN